MKECVVFVSFCVAGVRSVLNEIIIIFCANSGHRFLFTSFCADLFMENWEEQTIKQSDTLLLLNTV